MLTVKFVPMSLIEDKQSKTRRTCYLVTFIEDEITLAKFELKHNAATGWKSLIGAAARQLRKQVEGVEGAVAEKPTSQLEIV